MFGNLPQAPASSALTIAGSVGKKPVLLVLATAQALVTAAARDRQLQAESVPLNAALGRVLAADVVARVDNPAFDNSAMDGFAVRVADFTTVPIVLPCAELIPAGAAPGAILQAGACTEIMTGAPLPMGTDAIVPVEQARRTEGGIEFVDRPALGRHIRRQAEDFACGQMLLPAGTKLSEAQLLPLSGAGVGLVSVRRRPKVAILATGAELVTDLTQPLAPGQIYDSNRLFAHAFLTGVGADVVFSKTITDDPATLASALAAARAAMPDLIVTTGGVSAGKLDFIPQILTEAGAEILFHKIAMKPGKPQLCARLPDGVPIFSLPGNPSSAAVGLRFLVWPYLKTILRLNDGIPLRARLATDAYGHDSMTLILKARLSPGPDGTLIAHIQPGQNSFEIAPFLAMSGWIILPPGTSEPAGAVVIFRPNLPGVFSAG